MDNVRWLLARHVVLIYMLSILLGILAICAPHTMIKQAMLEWLDASNVVVTQNALYVIYLIIFRQMEMEDVSAQIFLL